MRSCGPFPRNKRAHMPEQTSPKSGHGGPWNWFKEQMAVAPLIGEYFIPEETNNIWYALGGVLAISLALQAVTGVILTLKYVPDSTQAYAVVSAMLHSPFWAFMIGFHYFNAFLIFGLVAVHITRVFLSGAYRRGKQGLWLVGVALAAVLFVAYVTGEALHWDELGFAVPWHMSEFFDAVGLNGVLHYTTDKLLNTRSATVMLSQIYATHIATVPILLLLLIPLHFYLIKMKGISLPFWRKPSGKKVPFSTHLKAWTVYGAFMIGAVMMLAIFVGRSPGAAPQLLPSSPYYQKEGDAGDFGYKPSAPIGWTNGWNMMLAEHGVDQDIWGTIIATVLMFGALVAVPFVDRGDKEPADLREVFDFRKRGWAFLMMALIWAVFLIGVISNILAGSG